MEAKKENGYQLRLYRSGSSGALRRRKHKLNGRRLYYLILYAKGYSRMEGKGREYSRNFVYNVHGYQLLHNSYTVLGIMVERQGTARQPSLHDNLDPRI